jgi:hypothetical protein
MDIWHRSQLPRASPEAIMAVDEARRHAQHESARQSFGDDQGDALMELLPPVGWVDVATKHDLAALEERLELRLRAAMGDQTRWLAGLIFVAFGIFGIIVRVV